MRVIPIACLSDNYAYLVICEASGNSVIVDASEAAPVLAAVEAHSMHPCAIWSTHHHIDHVGGNDEVSNKLGIRDIYGHVSDRGRIPGQTRFLETGDSFELGALNVRAIHIPGHTLGAVAYVVTDTSSRQSSVVFTGDTLFIAGCGRLFEGTPAQMHDSLSKLAALDGATLVYSGHEYTESNLRFAAHVEPSSARVKSATLRARQTRQGGMPTVGSPMSEELETNPFLRVNSAEIRRILQIAPTASEVESFAAIRKAKDNFR